MDTALRVTSDKNQSKRAGTKLMRSKLLVALLACATIAAVVGLASCGGVSGTYADSTGAMVLVLQSGGNATFTFAGQTGNCTYTSSGSTVNLTCPGQAGAVAFTLANGTLTGPSDSFFPPLHKK